MTTIADKVVEAARKIGAEHGKNAAAWWEQDAFGGRSSLSAAEQRTAAARLKMGLEDGDPEAMDAVPAADLSGQMADGLTPKALIEEAVSDTDLHRQGLSASNFQFQPLEDEICQAYEDAFNEAAHDAVMSYCDAVLEVEDE